MQACGKNPKSDVGILGLAHLVQRMSAHKGLNGLGADVASGQFLTPFRTLAAQSIVGVPDATRRDCDIRPSLSSAADTQISSLTRFELLDRLASRILDQLLDRVGGGFNVTRLQGFLHCSPISRDSLRLAAWPSRFGCNEASDAPWQARLDSRDASTVQGLGFSLPSGFASERTYDQKRKA
jgi:hypothetical protein